MNQSIRWFGQDDTPIDNFVKLFGRQPSVVWVDQKLGETLNMFRNGRSHMAIVRTVNDTGPVRIVLLSLVH
jgi:CBS domain containing-hemolysin-like protein